MRLLSQKWRADGSMKTCCTYCLIDVVLTVAVGILCWVLFAGFIPPYKRGFYCGDQAINLPFKPNTVSVGLLLVVSISVPMLLVVLCESLYWGRAPNLVTAINENQKAEFRRRQIFAVATAVNVEYLFGLIVVAALMHFGKSAFGILRPHFLDVCRPNTSLSTCSLEGRRLVDGNWIEDVAAAAFYIHEPYCTSKEMQMIKVARESFPSGHASMSVYALMFVLCYLRDRPRRFAAALPKTDVCSRILCFPIWRYAFGLLFTAWTAFVCVTRVTDHWHHPSDVAGGIVLGVTVGLLLFFRKDSAFKTGHLQAKLFEY